jgi:mono/diheme cytochrome c family protein
MAISSVDPSARNEVELGSVTNWPIVYAAAGVGLLLIVGLAAVGVIALTQATPAPTAAEPVAELRPAPPPRPAGAPTRTAPLPAAKPSAEASLWKPLVPAPGAVSFPVVKPIIKPLELVSAPIPPQQQTVATTPESKTQFSNDLQANVRQIDLDAVEGTSLRLLAIADQRSGERRYRRDVIAFANEPPLSFEDSVLSISASRADLAGLPMRGESESKASKEAAKCLEELSPVVRNAVARSDRLNRDGRAAATTDESKGSPRDQSLIKLLAERTEWLKDEYSPGLSQMLCAETVPVRLQLTKMLDATKGPNASVALARQTLFDLSPQVRQAAIQALTARPRAEYRNTLTAGFRYPLPVVAERAAEALTAVEDRGAAADLVKLLDLPDPAAPVVNEKKKWAAAEIVKVNHLRNCVLCHAPARNDGDPVRGFVPVPGEKIPVAYYGQGDGDFVRADVTYLRQDFSLMEDVPDPGKWPARQRFDYMVRQRELTEQEIADRPEPAKSYPQREAVRLALKQLTAPSPLRPER